MKRIIMVTAFVVGTALYILSAAWAYDYMDLYIEPASQTEVRQQVKGGYIETDHTSFYTCNKATSAQDLYDKNVEDTDEPDYYYAFGVESSSTSSYIVTQIQDDSRG